MSKNYGYHVGWFNFYPAHSISCQEAAKGVGRLFRDELAEQAHVFCRDFRLDRLKAYARVLRAEEKGSRMKGQ